MTPTDVKPAPTISFTQLDQYLRCPLRYRLIYIDHLQPDFVPAARAFGSGIHVAAASFFRAVAKGETPAVDALHDQFDSFWTLETEHQPLRYGEKETKENLRDLATRMLAVLHREFDPRTEVLAVEEPFRVPLINQETGEVLDRDITGVVDLIERDAEQNVVVVDLKTAARKFTDLQVEASLQLSVYSYAMAFNPVADRADVRLRFDVLTKTREPELHRYWTTRDRAANVRLYRMAAEVMRAIEAGAFHPIVGWQCRECPFRSKCWAWG